MDVVLQMPHATTVGAVIRMTDEAAVPDSTPDIDEQLIAAKILAPHEPVSWSQHWLVRNVDTVIAELAAVRAERHALKAMTRTTTFIAMQVNRDNERVKRARAERERDCLRAERDASRRHVPGITKAREGWGVFCSACSADAQDYVYPCKFQVPWLDEPPPKLVDAREVAIASATALRDAADAFGWNQVTIEGDVREWLLARARAVGMSDAARTRSIPTQIDKEI